MAIPDTDAAERELAATVAAEAERLFRHMPTATREEVAGSLTLCARRVLVGEPEQMRRVAALLLVEARHCCDFAD
jgi:hypothetical protein